jgi:hypothetical protein
MSSPGCKLFSISAKIGASFNARFSKDSDFPYLFPCADLVPSYSWYNMTRHSHWGYQGIQ